VHGTVNPVAFDWDPRVKAPLAPPGTLGLASPDLEVLRLIANGESIPVIARTLCYSESTIKKVIRLIMAQLGATNRRHAVAIALRTQII
jgi:DNA-binding NarL/FixJ family response regulator